MQIIPIRDLKDTVKVENLCVETKSPVFITKNGYGKLVVMDIECFERLISKAYEAELLNKGIEDLENGKVADAKAVLQELKEKYGI